MLFISTAVTIALGAICARIVYLCYFHPLARYPGPFLARFTNLWFVSLCSVLSLVPPSGRFPLTTQQETV